jgi:DNA-directed RNA polymerase specialized sigma24 family protein
MAKKNEDFGTFVRSSLDGLRRTAYLITWDATEAEDLVQECLFRVSRHGNRIGVMEHCLAYTWRVLVRLAIRGPSNVPDANLNWMTTRLTLESTRAS